MRRRFHLFILRSLLCSLIPLCGCDIFSSRTYNIISFILLRPNCEFLSLESQFNAYRSQNTLEIVLRLTWALPYYIFERCNVFGALVIEVTYDRDSATSTYRTEWGCIYDLNFQPVCTIGGPVEFNSFATGETADVNVSRDMFGRSTLVAHWKVNYMSVKRRCF